MLSIPVQRCNVAGRSHGTKGSLRRTLGHGRGGPTTMRHEHRMTLDGGCDVWVCAERAAAWSEVSCHSHGTPMHATEQTDMYCTIHSLSL